MSKGTEGPTPYAGSGDANPYRPDLSDPHHHTVARVSGHHDHAGVPAADGHGGHGGHGWMMMICCIPMLLIAVGLMVTGAASPGILVPAILCILMMALMMRAMPGGGHGNH